MNQEGNSSLSPIIRKFIHQFFNDQELETFCFDYFQEVNNEFTLGMQKGQKVIILIDYCLRRGKLPDLLLALQGERPNVFDEAINSKINIGRPSPPQNILRSVDKLDPTETDSQLDIPAICLRETMGQAAGNEYKLQKTQISIGRHFTCDISLSEEKKISRKHVEISIKENKIWLKDLNSKNRTFLISQTQMEETVIELGNQPVQLKPGDRFRLGTVVEFELLME